MTIFIENDCKCYASDDGTRRAFDVSFFDGKCTEFIEGYRFVPSGETWTRSDGQTFTGEIITPWRDYEQLYKAQLEYEVAQYQAALSEIETALGVTT